MINGSYLPKLIRLALIFMAVSACSGDEKNIPRNLINYRVLAVLADPPQVMLSDVLAGTAPTVKVRAVDFELDDITGISPRTYQWTVCFSVGPATQFACLDDAYAITQMSDSPTFEFTPDLATLTQLLPPEFLEQIRMTTTGLELPVVDGSSPCGESVGQSCNSESPCPSDLTCEDGYCAPPPRVIPLPLVIKLRGETKNGNVREAARSLPLILYGGVNQNPAIKAIKLGDGELFFSGEFDGSCAQIGPFAPQLDEIPLTVQLDDERFEDYSVFDGVQCLERSEKTDFTIAWYTSLGDLERGLGGEGLTENTLRFESPLTDSRLYFVLRDGRGGLAVRCIQFSVTEPTRDAP